MSKQKNLLNIMASLKGLKDKTGGSIDLLKPKGDSKKGDVDKGKTGTTQEKQPPKPPKPPETPPLPGDEDGKSVGVSGRSLNVKEIEKIKKQYGAEEVIGEPGNFHVFKNGKWMRPEEVKVSTDTAEGQGDDPTKGPLFAAAQNLWEAKQLDNSGQQPVDYGPKPERSGSDPSKKINGIHKKLTTSKTEEHEESSTKPSKKTKKPDKTGDTTVSPPPVKPPATPKFKCKSNKDCWTKYGSNQYYCNKGNGKCIKCSPGYHGKKDGTAACCKD